MTDETVRPEDEERKSQKRKRRDRDYERVNVDVIVPTPFGGLKNIDVRKAVVTLIVFAVLFPAMRYSVGLSAPQPAELIVAICIAVFSSLLCLWLLDVTGVFPFRSVWVSRAVYGAAVLSILGTSAGVYQGAFSDRKYPLEGDWTVRVADQSGKVLAKRTVVLIHSERADTYWGYSDYDPKDAGANWLEVASLSTETGSTTIKMVSNGTTSEVTAKIKAATSRRIIDPAAVGDEVQVTFLRQR